MLKSTRTTFVVVIVVIVQAAAIAAMYHFKQTRQEAAQERAALSEILEKPPSNSALGESSDPLAETSGFEVLYTAKGFEPQRFDLPVGARVTFKNMSQEPLLVASEPFPSHIDYPGFVAPAAIGYGESFAFSFDQSGTYGFGNEMRPDRLATVEVGNADADYSADDKTPDTQIAIRAKLYGMMSPGKPASIFQVIDTIEADAALSRNCHSLAHDLGHYAYKLYGFSGAMNISDATRMNKASVQDVCAGGYVHGILEEAALHRPDFGANPGVLCENVTAAARSSCLHGLGHALMFTYGRDLAVSTSACRSLAGPGDKYPCFEGVYMEFFWGSLNTAKETTLGWDLKRPLTPCLNAGTDARAACFLYSVFGYLRTHYQDYKGAISLCTNNNLGASDVAYCMKGVGITMISHFSGHNLEQAEPFVDGLSPEYKTAFYKGLIGYARFSGISKDALESTCGLLVSDKDLCIDVLKSEV